MCLLKIAEPVSEHIFEQTKHRIVIVLASELTISSYLNLSSVIPEGKHHFTKQMDFEKFRKRGSPSQVWHLIVSIPDLCILPYFAECLQNYVNMKCLCGENRNQLKLEIDRKNNSMQRMLDRSAVAQW